MYKTITYSNFIIASLVVIVAFVTATTYTQLVIAILLYPLLAYFAFKILPRENWKAPEVTIQLPAFSASNAEKDASPPKRENAGIADNDKRAFLKMIGAAGISFFLYSIFIKRTGVPFFGNVTGPETLSLKDATDHKIDPAEKLPTDGYVITEIDDSIIAFYGFTNKEGAWFVIREDSDTGSFRYVRGDLDFTSNWGNREHLTYDYYTNVF